MNLSETILAFNKAGYSIEFRPYGGTIDIVVRQVLTSDGLPPPAGHGQIVYQLNAREIQNAALDHIAYSAEKIYRCIIKDTAEVP